MSYESGPNKKSKTYHLHTEWEVDCFFHYAIFEVCMPHPPLGHRYTEKGNGERHFGLHIKSTALPFLQRAA